MKKGKLAAVALLAATVVLGAQEIPPTQRPLPVPPRAIEVQVPEGAILSFRPRGKTKVELIGTERTPSAWGEVEIGSRPGYVEIEIGRGDLRGLQPARHWGRDFLTYVLWVVPVSGAAINVGEIVFRDGRSEGLKVSTPYRTFWLLVTAEPDFAVHEPSQVAVLVSRNQDETRTGNKAIAVPRPLLYYTHFTDYDMSPTAGELSPGVPSELRQARHAVPLAARNEFWAGPAPPGEGLPAAEKRARELLERARAYLAEAEAESRRTGDIEAMALYARTAVEMAEGARALVVGAAGGAAVRHLLTEREKFRTSAADTQQELTSLGDRLSQVEAALDGERRRTRELESQLLAVQEKESLLGATLEKAQQETARLQEERNRLCDELRHQLASLGPLTRQGNQLALSLAADLLFESKPYNLQPAAREKLAKLVVLRRLLFPQAPVRFEGHTDLVGDENYNQWLSEQRALAVYRYFLQAQLASVQIPDERVFLKERLRMVEQLLDMNYNTARRQAARRQKGLALLANAVVGKGMREPLIPEKGPNEQNRRVTLLFPQTALGGLSSLCPAGPSAPRGE